MKGCRVIVISAAVFLFAAFCFLIVRLAYPRPYREEVQASGLSPSLVYAVIKAESGFREDAVSRAGAVGLMQVKPSTAEFICTKRGVAFDASRLCEGGYNVTVGCMYLAYLLERFPQTETALAAYNAGEGTVRRWLQDGEVSSDGNTLDKIPYAETSSYVKKVLKFRKIYHFFYG